MEPMTMPAMEPPSRLELESSLLLVSDVEPPPPPLLAGCVTVTVTVATGPVDVWRRTISPMMVLVGSNIARSANCSSEARDNAGKGAIAVVVLLFCCREREC